MKKDTLKSNIENLKTLFLRYKNKNKTIKEEMGLNNFLEIFIKYIDFIFEERYCNKLLNFLNALIPVFDEYNYRDQTNARVVNSIIWKYSMLH